MIGLGSAMVTMPGSKTCSGSALDMVGEDVRRVGDEVDAVDWIGRDCTPFWRKNLRRVRMSSSGLPGLISATISRSRAA